MNRGFLFMKINHQFSNTLVMQPMPGIGDMLWFLPHVRAIADRFVVGDSVTLLARPSTQSAKLLSEESCVKEVLPLYRCQMNRQGNERESNHREKYRHDGMLGAMRLAREMAVHQFDAVWSLDRRAYYVYASVLAGIPNRFGLGFGWEKVFLKNPALPKEHHKTHARDRVTHWLEGMGINIKDYEYPLKIELQATKKVREHFKKTKPWACLGLGASEIEKKWSVEAFGALSKSLFEKGVEVFLCGGAGEKVEAEAIQRLAPKVHCITDWSVMETAALMTESDFYVGNDTFLYNLAALQGKKSLSVSGEVPSHMYLESMMTVHSPKGVQHVSPARVLEKMVQEQFL